MPFKSRAQKEYLRINEPEIYERWMRDYDAESFTPPASAVSAAKKGLSQRKKWGRGGLSPADAKSQGIDSGVTRARKISSGKVSRHDVRRMSAFNRHRQNNNPSKKMPDGGPTAGTIAWNLWGGTSGVNWAKKKSAAMNAETFESPVSCKICGKTFDSFRGLNGHMNAHLRAETFGDVDSDGQLAQALARARAKSQEPRRPLKITKLPHRDQTSLKDFEAESNTPLFTKESKVFAIGLASGIVATIFGNLLSEFVIDRYREDPELLDTEQNA